jgi:hypothetical protein
LTPRAASRERLGDDLTGAVRPASEQ